MAIPQAGNVVLGGSLAGTTVQFGTTTLPGVPLVENAFVAKMSAQGSWLWAVCSGNRSGRVALGAAGNVYCTGNFVGASLFGSFALTANGLQDEYVGKLDPAGTWLWVRSTGGLGYEYAAGVGVDYAGNVLVAGGFGVPSATFGTLTIPNRGGGNFDAYVVKLDANGNFLWAEGMSGTDNDVAKVWPWTIGAGSTPPVFTAGSALGLGRLPWWVTLGPTPVFWPRWATARLRK